jgi:hypothetical protein
MTDSHAAYVEDASAASSGGAQAVQTGPGLIEQVLGPIFGELEAGQ